MRYKNREPRPEDLAMIKKLQLAVKEQERKMKEILVIVQANEIYYHPHKKTFFFLQDGKESLSDGTC